MSQDMNEFEGYSFYATTIQASIFKSLIESIKEILPDTTIEVSNESIRVLSMDPTHSALVHLTLESENFEKFHCLQNQILGVNMVNFFKLIKIISTKDILTLFVKSSDLNHLGIRIENPTKNTSTTFKLNLMDLDNSLMRIPPAKFKNIITMKSTDFQKTCRDMLNISDEIEIKTVDKTMVLTCRGTFADQKTVIGESTTNGFQFSVTEEEDDEDKIVQGIFNLKYLTLFAKCSSLSPSINIFLKNNYPIILGYRVGSLGSLKMCLAPKNQS